jgi:hypothetical protein
MLYEFAADMLRKRDGADSVRLYRDEPHHHHCGKHLPYLCSSQSLLYYISPLVSAIEVMSFLTRPLSHSVRLFANMLAGHITLKVFAGFIIMLGGAGVLGIFGATLPFVMTLMLTALELLVAVLQAYVFAILTCIYLNVRCILGIKLHDSPAPRHFPPAGFCGA